MAAGPFEQSRHEPLPLGPRRLQAADEVLRLFGKRVLSLASQRLNGGDPSPFKFAPCLALPQFGGLIDSICRP
jgi:hypothetical protein